MTDEKTIRKNAPRYTSPIIKLGRLAIYNLGNLRVVPYDTLAFFQKYAPETLEEVFSSPKPVFGL